MAITQIFEKYVQGDDIAITVNTSEDNTGYTCVSKIEDYNKVTVATFTPEVVSDTQILLSLDGAISAGIPAGKYKWDVKLISPAGKQTTMVRGIFEFLESA